MLGVVRVFSHNQTSMLADDQGRIILFEIDTDVSQSFCTMRDVVRDTYVGMEMDENKLMCVDKGPTTRNMLYIKGSLDDFMILGTAESGAQLSMTFSIVPVYPRLWE